MSAAAQGVVFDSIPKFLREFCLWCLWLASYIDAEGVTQVGKFPCSPSTGRRIRVNDRVLPARLRKAV
jgi:hypothetical protein